MSNFIKRLKKSKYNFSQRVNIFFVNENTGEIHLYAVNYKYVYQLVKRHYATMYECSEIINNITGEALKISKPDIKLIVIKIKALLNIW